MGYGSDDVVRRGHQPWLCVESESEPREVREKRTCCYVAIRYRRDYSWIGSSPGLFISATTISTVFLRSNSARHKAFCYELSVGYPIPRHFVSFSFLLLFILFLVIHTNIFSFYFLVILSSLNFILVINKLINKIRMICFYNFGNTVGIFPQPCLASSW
jgi:hypothetical protein